MPIPPSTAAGTAPNHEAVMPGLELAELVGRADENGVHRAHAAAVLIGRVDLHEGLAHDDAHHVRRAQHRQCPQGQEEGPRQPENDRHEPEKRDAREHPRSRAARQWSSGQAQRHDPCADSRRAPQEAKPPWPDVQDVAGVDRQQRRGSAEEHGKKVHGDGPQDGGP